MRLETLIRNQIGFFTIIVAFALMVGGCQGDNGGGGAASVHLALSLPHATGAASKAAFASALPSISSVRLDVSGPNMNPLSTTVPINTGGDATVVIEVPIGLARHFVVTAFDGENTPLFRGEATIDLAPNSSPSLTISMVAINPNVPPRPPSSIQVSPHTAVVAKDSSQTFSVSGIDLSQVQWEVTSTAGNDPDKVGSVATDGDYAPPATIPTDAADGLIGNPIPVTVTAIDKNTPTVRDSATVQLTTGSLLTFDQNRRLTSAPRSVSTQYAGQRNVAFYNGKMYAVWVECPDNCSDLFFSESSDGINWAKPTPVGQGSSIANPQMAVSSDGNVYVTYVDCLLCGVHAIQLAVRPFAQTAFKAIPLTMVSPSPQAQEPMVAVAASGVAFVVWSDINPRSQTGRDIYLQRIPTDSAPKKINTDTENVNQSRPVISIANTGEVFLAWEDQRNNQKQEIFAAASINGGDSFLVRFR